MPRAQDRLVNRLGGVERCGKGVMCRHQCRRCRQQSHTDTHHLHPASGHASLQFPDRGFILQGATVVHNRSGVQISQVGQSFAGACCFEEVERCESVPGANARGGDGTRRSCCALTGESTCFSNATLWPRPSTGGFCPRDSCSQSKSKRSTHCRPRAHTADLTGEGRQGLSVTARPPAHGSQRRRPRKAGSNKPVSGRAAGRLPSPISMATGATTWTRMTR